jgi:uncharacterized membrane-anchored protein YhcB (DUF1043 family)
MFFNKKLLIIHVVLILLVLNSCNLMNKSEKFEKANSAIYTLYMYYNNNKSVNDVDLYYSDYGEFSSIVKLEKEYLKSRQSQNENIDKKSTELENLKIETNDSIDEYNDLVDDIIQSIEDNYSLEIKSNKNLLTDLSNLEIDKSYLNIYLENTKERIEFEEKNFLSINEKNIEILEKSKELMNLYKSNNYDNSKSQKLKNELNSLNNEYNKLLNNFNIEIKKIMNSIYDNEN